MTKLLVQANKEWMEFRRDRLSLSLAFLLPIFSLLLLGYGVRLQGNDIPMVVQDRDGSQLSRDYTSRLFATNVFTPVQLAKGQTSPTQAIDDGRAKVGVIIPKGFSDRVTARKSTALQVLVDGTDIADSQIVSNSIKAVNGYFLEMLGEKSFNGDARIIVPKTRIWFNPGRSEALFLVPGVFGVVLWMFPCLLSAVAASREKEQGTIVRVYAAKLSALDWLLGKALVYFLIGMSMAVFVIGLGCFLFHLAPAGNPIPFLIATPLFVFVSVAFGLLLGACTSSQTTAVQATSTAGFFPCLLLSGFVYPIANIPFPLSLFSIAVPARYYIDLTRNTFVRGAGWSAVGMDTLALVIFICVYIFFAWFGTRRMQLKS
jgi:ABC-2 type transport system permease protein